MCITLPEWIIVRHCWVFCHVVSVLSSGSGVTPHPELPQGQMDSLLSIISSQRERFRSRNQELEVVSHRLSPTFRTPMSFSGSCKLSFVCFFCLCLQENRSMKQTMQALQSELDSLRADNIKLYEKIKFLQSYPGRVCHCDCMHGNVHYILGVMVDCAIWAFWREIQMSGFSTVGWR